MKRCSLVLLLSLFAAACSMPPPAPQAPLALKPDDKLNLDVGQILLVDHSHDQAPVPPVVDRLFQPTLDAALRKWANDNLRAVGLTGRASFTISNVYVTEQALPIQKNFFERQQASKYVGHADVSLEAEGNEGYGMATATAVREVTLPEDPTEDEKEQAYSLLINGLMQDIGTYLNRGIHANLQAFVVTAPVISDQPMAAPVPASPAFAQ